MIISKLHSIFPGKTRDRFYSLFPHKIRKKVLYLKDLLLHWEIEHREFFVLDDKKCAFLVVPKSANTSIKITIGKTYGIKTDEDQAIHGSSFVRNNLYLTLENAERYFKFSFVRNPYARLVSCYTDKIIRKPHYFEGYIFRIARNITFAEFVKKTVKIPDFLADKHFKSQYSVLYRRGKLLVDYVGKVENIEQDWLKVAEKCGFEPSVVRENVSTPKGNKRDYRLFYTQELAELVYQRYRNDFELLGYQTAHQELLDFLKN
jgi:hypothetical protein